MLCDIKGKDFHQAIQYTSETIYAGIMYCGVLAVEGENGGSNKVPELPEVV